MTTASVTTFVTTAGSIGRALLTLPLVVAQAGDTADSTRTIDVKLSRYAFSPERIEVRLGERAWLNVASVDSAHGVQVKELGLNARTGHSRMKARLIVTPGT